jgi:hypothetical protein
MNRNPSLYTSLSPEHRALVARAIADVKSAAPFQQWGQTTGTTRTEWNNAIRNTAIKAVLIAYDFDNKEQDQEPQL